MKPPIEFRPKRARPESSKKVAKPAPAKVSKPVKSAEEDAAAVLAHKRQQKAAQMKRYRANLKKREKHGK